MSSVLLPLTSFTLFSTLPTELRLAIWDLLITPNIIFIRDLSRNHHTEPARFSHAFHAPSNTHTLLQTCHESRLIILQFYTFMFSRNFGRGAKGGFWYDLKRDALCLPSLYSLKRFFRLRVAEDLKGRDGVERKLRTIIVGEDKDEIMRQFDFNRVGMPEVFISVKQGEVANRFRAAREVSWGFVPPKPEEIMDLTSCGLKGVRIVRRVEKVGGSEIVFAEMTMDTLKVFLGVEPAPKDVPFSVLAITEKDESSPPETEDLYPD